MHPLLLLALGSIVGLLASPPVPLVGLGGLLVGLLLFARRYPAGMGPVGLVFGALLGHSLPAGPALTGRVAVQGVVAAAPMGRQADLRVWACSEAGRAFKPCRGRVRVRFPEPVGIGTSWVVRGTAHPPRSPTLTGGPDPAQSARLAHVHTVIWADAAVPLGTPPTKTPPQTGAAAVLTAVATGVRSGVDPQTWDLLRDTGTAHLLAISGFHVGVVAGLVGGLVNFGLRRAALLRPVGISPVYAWWAGALAGVAYAVFAGAPISAQRAAGVGLLAAIGRSMHRKVEPLRLIAVIALAVCVVDPAAVTTPSFQLSFGAVVGLIRFGSMFDALLGWFPTGLKWAGKGLVATFAATLGTLPAAAWWFQSLSITSPLANLFAVPFMAVAVVPFAILATVLPDPIASGCRTVGSLAVEGMLWMLRLLEVDPLAPAVGAVGAVLLCAVFLRARPGWIGAVLWVVLGLRTVPAGGLEVTFYNVGQGDAAVVFFPDGKRWLVDAGRSARILPKLRRDGIRRIDVVVESHPDKDHAGGIPSVLCGLRVGELWVGSLDSPSVEAAHACGVPVVLKQTAALGSDNNNSLVVRAESAWGSVLFTGDIEAEREELLSGPATILKVPHHGSKTSSSATLLDRIRPTLAVLSVGHNYYGHPHQAVLDRYADYEIPVVSTEAGAVTTRLDDQGIHVRQRGTWKTLKARPDHYATTVSMIWQP